MELKDRLRELRESIVLEDGKKCSQKQFAEIIGVKQNNYNNWENGREPNLQTLIKIADYYGVTLDYLVGHSDEKHPELKGIREITRLSEEAIQGLERFMGFFQNSFFMNTILEEYGKHTDRITFLSAISWFFLQYAIPDYNDPMPPNNESANYIEAALRSPQTRGQRSDEVMLPAITELLLDIRGQFKLWCDEHISVTEYLNESGNVAYNLHMGTGEDKYFLANYTSNHKPVGDNHENNA